MGILEKISEIEAEVKNLSILCLFIMDCVILFNSFDPNHFDQIFAKKNQKTISIILTFADNW